MQKTKATCYAIILMFLLVNINVIGWKNIYADAKKEHTIAPEIKPWTYMFYADGDWPGGSPLATIYLVPKGISSGENVNIVVLQDTPDEPATLWYINEYGNPILLEQLGEKNMGNYTTLRDFINFCKNNFTADRYMINLWDHGGAWVGACWDETSNYDNLKMDEIKQALKESGGVNIISFSACEMGCIESAYELKNYTDVYIGSEEMHGMSDEMVDVARYLNEKPNESTYNISEKIIYFFIENFPYFGYTGQWRDIISQWKTSRYFLYPPAETLSAIRTDKLEILVSSIDIFAHILLKDINFFKPMITRERFTVDDFSYPMKFKPPYIMGDQIDIYHFTELMDKPRYRLLKPELHDAVQQVQENLEQAIIAEHHQIGHRNAHGLSMYFPPIHKDYQSEYSTSNLDFTYDTHWDEFLEAYRS